MEIVRGAIFDYPRKVNSSDGSSHPSNDRARNGSINRGGTSDGRFIAKLGCELVELGPVNRSIHKIDEEVKIEDLRRLKDLYQGLLVELIS